MEPNNIHCMTNTYPGTKLRVELGDWKGKSYYAEYSQFIVGDNSTSYKLNNKQCWDTVGMLQISSPPQWTNVLYLQPRS